MPKSIQISAELIGIQQSLQKQIDAVTRGQGLKIPINDKAFNTSIQGMTSNVRRFEESLDYSNRRVIAFGTSASIVYGMVRGFKELVSATIDVEKRLTSINSIFGLSSRNLDSFSKSLFNVARETGQAFDEVAGAAEEFSRQGLGVEETLKRTRDAMILVRLTGLDTAKAVGTLTAAVNTFAKAGEDSTSIINKVVAADQRFAVSARDIAEAFQRVGSVVDDAGVSVDQFIGLVSAAKQITSRDGAVIGNSLKTILTRLEKSTTIDDLEALGIAVRDASGQAKPALQVFNELAKSYGNLSREQQQLVAQLGGGVFQINQFKALLSDLGKANGIAAQAEKAAANATNEAIIRNATLNDTLATSIQNLKTSATQAGAVIGSLSLKPLLQDGLSFGNLLAGAFKNIKATGDSKAGEDFGAYFGESILKGIGNVLSGPGLIIIPKIIGGLFNRARPEILNDLKSAYGLLDRDPSPSFRGVVRNFISPQSVGETEALKRTSELLSTATKEEQARYLAAKNVAEQEAIILGIIERQALVLGSIAGKGPKKGGRTPFGASGYIPFGEEMAAISQGVGGAPSSARPVFLPDFNRGNGQFGIVANTSEYRVPNMAGGGEAIFNQAMVQRYGLPPGSKPVAASGFIPNVAEGSLKSATEIALGKSPNAPFSTYEAAIRRLISQEQELENVWSEITSRFSNTILKSAATLNANAAIADLGNVFAYGPPDLRNPYQIAASQAQIITAQSYSRPNLVYAPIPAGDPEIGAGGRGGIDPDYVIKTNRRSLDEKLTKAQQLEQDRAAFFAASDARQREIAFNRAVNRVQSGEDITPAQQKLIQDTLQEKARQIANKTFAPGTSQQAIKSFVSSWADAQIENLNKAGNAALEQKQITFDQINQAKRDQQILAQVQKRERLSSRLQFGLLGASFATGFIPRGESGQTSGELSGAITGGLNTAATGAFTGSLFGPTGTIIGAAVGGLGGALKGLIDRTTKSVEEVAADIQKEQEKFKKQADAVSQAFAIQGQISEGLDRGLLSKTALAKLRRDRERSISDITDPEIRRLVRSGNPDDQIKANQLIGDSAIKSQTEAAIRYTFAKSIGSGDYSKENLTEAASALRGKYVDLSDAELAKILANSRNQTSAGVQGQVFAGGSSFFDKVGQYLQLQGGPFGGLGSLITSRTTANAGQFTQDAIIKAISAEIQRRTDEKISLEQQNKPIPNYISRVDSLALAARIGVSGQLAQIRAGGAFGVEQTRQRIALEAPGITDLQRLALEGRFGRTNITSQADITRAATISAGKTAIIQSLSDAGVTDRSFIEGRLANASGKSDLIDLQRDLKSITSSNPNQTLAKTQEAIKDLIDKLTVLNATEQENVRTNDESNSLLAEQLRQSKELPAVQANLATSLSEARKRQIVTDQAVINLSANPDTSKFVTGGDLSGALFNKAQRAGQAGKSEESFARGFGSVFAGAAKDARNFAEVGQQVASSLQNSFSNAFGDFVTGAKRAKDAFKDFIRQVLAESARIFATKAIVSLLGSFLGGIGGGFNSGSVSVGSPTTVGLGLTSTPNSFLANAGPTFAQGGFVKRASGGGIPTMLTGGEFVYPPDQASRIGGRMLKAINGGTIRGFAPGGLVRGGSGVQDDVFQPLAAGSFVVRKSMVERYGANNLATLSMGGYPDSAVSPTTLYMDSGGSVYGNAASSIPSTNVMVPVSGGGGGTFNIGVTINDNSTTTQSSSNNQGSNLNDRQFGETLLRRMKAVALQTIEEQKRMGGILRPQSNLFPS